MSRLVARAAAAAVALALVAGASACGGGKSFAIPAGYQTSDPTYTLLYSTVGYELAGPKRLLIRQNDTIAQISEGLAFSWRIVDERDSVALEGRATYSGNGWGIPIWTADFSALNKPGRYRMVVQAPDVNLATQPFEVDDFLLFKSTFQAVALDNAAARQAPIELDNGYFDGNGKSGGAAAHADWAVGLIESYERRRTALTDDQRRQLREAIDRAVDYLLLLSDPATGEFDYKSPTRPFGDEGAYNTAGAMRALARYAASFQRDDPSKADRAYRRALLAEDWLTKNAPEAYTPALRATVDYDLYRYSLIERYLDAAAQAVRDEAATYDLRTMNRSGADTFPHFEGMYRMWRDLTFHADRQFWAETATAVAAQYKQAFDANPFRVVPTGVTDVEAGHDAAKEWDESATVAPPGEGGGETVSNGWFLGRAIDATYLADMTGDASLRVMASAEIGWITGLNPGIAAGRVRGAQGVSPVEAASFLTGLPVRTAEPWSTWEWVRPRRFGTIVNGFRYAFTYDDGFQGGETSMAFDGAWLYAMAAYEDYLEPARRAPAPDPLAPYERAMHVATAEGSETGGTLQMLVRVVDGPGQPAPAARVMVLWEAPVADDGGDPEQDGVAATECTTGADGNCLVTIAPGALGGGRPITASVVNLEHPELAYDIDADTQEKVATFP